MSNKMNFSDETVEAAIHAFAEANRAGSCPDHCVYEAIKAALSSLTLADLMQVEEIRELVNGGRRAARILDDTGYDPDTFDALAEALTPFTEAK